MHNDTSCYCQFARWTFLHQSWGCPDTPEGAGRDVSCHGSNAPHKPTTAKASHKVDPWHHLLPHPRVTPSRQFLCKDSNNSENPRKTELRVLTEWDSPIKKCCHGNRLEYILRKIRTGYAISSVIYI